jgi:hypothetical protein
MPARQQAVESMVALHLLLEGHFGAGQKAHCHIRFSDGRETPRERVELRRHWVGVGAKLAKLAGSKGSAQIL